MSQVTQRRPFGAVIFGVLVSAITVLFAGPFLRVIRQQYGSFKYWLLAIVYVASLGFFHQYFLAMSVLLTWLSVGMQKELELRGWSFFRSTTFAIAVALGVGSVGTDALLFALGKSWQGLFADFAGILKQFPAFKEVGSSLASEWFASQLPSVAVISMLIGIVVASTAEDTVSQWLGVYQPRSPAKLKLSEFRVRDSYIWVFLASFALIVMGVGPKLLQMIATNIVSLSVILYFLQGLAVTVVFLKVTRAGFFTRALTVLVIMVGQGLLILGVLGLVDYWLDFRGRMRRQGSVRDL